MSRDLDHGANSRLGAYHAEEDRHGSSEARFQGCSPPVVGLHTTSPSMARSSSPDGFIGRSSTVQRSCSSRLALSVGSPLAMATENIPLASVTARSTLVTTTAP